MLQHNVKLDILQPIPSAVNSADVLHGFGVRALPVALFFGTLPLHVKGYAAAMLGHLILFKRLWQISNTALYIFLRQQCA